MDLVYVLYIYEDIEWLNILPIPFLHPTLSQGQGHGLRIFMLKFYVKVFRSSLFTNPVMDLVYTWYEYIFIPPAYQVWNGGI